jgi:hypothetical protein
MAVVIGCVLIVFWLRDYLSLRMSPPRKAVHRALAYGIAIVVTGMLIRAIAAKIGPAALGRTIHLPAIISVVIAFHAAASVPSIWVRQTERYNWMWLTALIPAPVVWLLLLETTVLSGHGLDISVAGLGFFAAAVLWVSSMAVVVFRSRYIQMSPDDLDFAVLFGSLSHWLAACALLLALAALA